MVILIWLFYVKLVERGGSRCFSVDPAVLVWINCFSVCIWKKKIESKLFHPKLLYGNCHRQMKKVHVLLILDGNCHRQMKKIESKMMRSLIIL